MSAKRFGGLPRASLHRRSAVGVAATILVAAIAAVVLSRVGCVNLHTAPGHEGYVRSQPFVGAGEFVGTQRGPTSTGWVWRQSVVNIDIRPRTFSEEMSILTRERLELTFRAHARIRLRAGAIRAVVEEYGGPKWYENNVRDQFRASVREKVQSLEPFEVKDQSLAIADAVLSDMAVRYEGAPIEFLSVDIGNIEYPSVVVESVIRKFVTNEDNERKDIELQIAQKQIEIGIAEAEGIADAQQIIRTSLDPMFLQYEALGAIEELSGSPNTTFVIAPYAPSGAAPFIMNLGAK